MRDHNLLLSTSDIWLLRCQVLCRFEVIV